MTSSARRVHVREPRITAPASASTSPWRVRRAPAQIAERRRTAIGPARCPCALRSTSRVAPARAHWAARRCSAPPVRVRHLPRAMVACNGIVGNASVGHGTGRRPPRAISTPERRGHAPAGERTLRRRSETPANGRRACEPRTIRTVTARADSLRASVSTRRRAIGHREHYALVTFQPERSTKRASRSNRFDELRRPGARARIVAVR